MLRSVAAYELQAARGPAVISSPDLGVLAVAAPGVLCAFSCVVDALPEQCLRRRPGADLLVAAVFRTNWLQRERCSATCLRRRRPAQARRRQGRLQITAAMAVVRSSLRRLPAIADPGDLLRTLGRHWWLVSGEFGLACRSGCRRHPRSASCTRTADRPTRMPIGTLTKRSSANRGPRSGRRRAPGQGGGTSGAGTAGRLPVTPLEQVPGSCLEALGAEHLEAEGVGEPAGRVERGADRQRVLDLPG